MKFHFQPTSSLIESILKANDNGKIKIKKIKKKSRANILSLKLKLDLRKCSLIIFKPLETNLTDIFFSIDVSLKLFLLLF